MVGRAVLCGIVTGLIVLATVSPEPAFAQKNSAKGRSGGAAAGVPLTKAELEETFTRTIFTFGAGDYPQGCEVHYGGNYGVPTFVKNCGRVDGTYGAWTWGDNELRFVGRGGAVRRLYFFRRPNGQYFIRDENGNVAEIASIRR